MAKPVIGTSILLVVYCFFLGQMAAQEPSNASPPAQEILSPRTGSASDAGPILAAVASIREPLIPNVTFLETEFDASDSNINWNAAITLAELSVLAYSDPHLQSSVGRMIGFDEIVSIHDGPMSAFVATTDKVAVICFRGTDMYSPRDWLTNANFFSQTRMGAGRKFHEGFQNAYQRLRESIEWRLQNRKFEFVWLTGHSLGGAMATCCAYDWINNRRVLTGLLTFGQPRVANPTMATFLNVQIGDRYLRFRNNEDIVPTVPPAGPAFLSDYSHAGCELWFQNGSISKKPPQLDSSAEVLIAPGQPTPLDSLGADEITAAQLIKLQHLLRESAQAEQLSNAVGRPGADQFRPLGDFLQQPLPADQTPEEAAIFANWTSKFSDHSMVEYIRFMNEHR